MNGFGVIFDMDGVLVDSYEAHFESWRRMLQPRGLEMTRDEFNSSFGQTCREIIRRVYGRHATDEAAVIAWDTQKEATYRAILCEKFPAMDGAIDLIRQLHDARCALAVGSSGPAENVAVVLEQLGAQPYFAATVDAGQIRLGKPHPEVFLKAAEKLGLPPSRCAVVEDSPHGIEAARRAGMAAVALVGTAARDRLAERAHLVVGSLRELTPQLFRDVITALKNGG